MLETVDFTGFYWSEKEKTAVQHSNFEPKQS